MSNSTKIVSLRLERDRFDRLVAVADGRKCRPSDIIRNAIDAYLGGASVLTASQLRMARISEFQQLALDIIIREQFPEFRDRIVAETDKRLEQYHGA